MSDAEAAVDRARIGDVDVVLMDLRFAGDATAGARATGSAPSPTPQVLVLTSHDTDRDIVGAIEAGACGYLLRTPDPTGSGAVRAAAAGGVRSRPPSPRPSWAGCETLGGPDRARDGSDAGGGRGRPTARWPRLSCQATVKTHLVHVFDKLGVASRTAAVARARELGLV